MGIVYRMFIVKRRKLLVDVVVVVVVVVVVKPKEGKELSDLPSCGWAFWVPTSLYQIGGAISMEQELIMVVIVYAKSSSMWTHPTIPCLHLNCPQGGKSLLDFYFFHYMSKVIFSHS